MKNNLKKYRENAGLSLQELGDMSGITQTHVHGLEKETGSAPRITTAYAIAKALDKSVYDIWPDTTEMIEEKIIVRRVVSA